LTINAREKKNNVNKCQMTSETLLVGVWGGGGGGGGGCGVGGGGGGGGGFWGVGVFRLCGRIHKTTRCVRRDVRAANSEWGVLAKQHRGRQTKSNDEVGSTLITLLKVKEKNSNEGE